MKRSGKRCGNTNSSNSLNRNLSIRKTSEFTIIELLVVVSIIALLLALLMPAIGAIRKRARITQTKEMENALIQAIKEYESVYQQLPIDPSTDITTQSTKECLKDDATYDKLITILSCIEGPAGTVDADGRPDDGNKRAVQFLEAPPDYGHSIAYRDAWGNRFRIFIDSDNDNDVDVFPGVTGEKTLNGNVFVYSLGPNEDTVKDSDGNNTTDINNDQAFPDKGDNHGTDDDICSWK